MKKYLMAIATVTVLSAAFSAQAYADDTDPEFKLPKQCYVVVYGANNMPYIVPGFCPKK